MNRRPSVSVIMAVKNAARYLSTALDSIEAQTELPLEIVVVDGRSTDATEAIASQYERVRFIQESGRGYAGAWNDGILASKGDLVAFLDSDDQWTPEKLRRQVDALVADPAARGAIGYVQFVAEAGRPIPSSFKPELLDKPLLGYMPGAFIARRDVFDDVGLFDPDWEIANDIDWFARAKDRQLRLAIVDEVLLYKRVHDQNTSYLATKSPVINTEMIRALRESIHRQRGRPMKPPDIS